MISLIRTFFWFLMLAILISVIFHVIKIFIVPIVLGIIVYIIYNRIKENKK